MLGALARDWRNTLVPCTAGFEPASSAGSER